MNDIDWREAVSGLCVAIPIAAFFTLVIILIHG